MQNLIQRESLLLKLILHRRNLLTLYLIFVFDNNIRTLLNEEF